LLASVEGDTAVRLKHWAKAQSIAEVWRASLHRVYDQISKRNKTEEADLEIRISEIVLKLKHPSAGQISNYIKSHSTPQVKRVADGMVEAGILQISPKRGRHGVLRYCLPDEKEESPTVEP